MFPSLITLTRGRGSLLSSVRCLVSQLSSTSLFAVDAGDSGPWTVSGSCNAAAGGASGSASALLPSISQVQRSFRTKERKCTPSGLHDAMDAVRWLLRPAPSNGADSSSSSLEQLQQRLEEEVLPQLEQRRQPDDQWLLVSCDDLEPPADGWLGPASTAAWTGPARALLHCWPDPPGSWALNYALIAVTPDEGLPVPELVYGSGTQLEQRTSRKGSRSWKISCKLVEPGTGKPGVSVKTWLKDLSKLLGSERELVLHNKNPSSRGQQGLTAKLLAVMGTTPALESSTQRPAQAHRSSNCSTRSARWAAGTSAAGDVALLRQQLQQLAADSAGAAAEAAAAGRAQHLMPGPPGIQPTRLHMAPSGIHQREKLMSAIRDGTLDLADDHVLLSELQQLQQQQQQLGSAAATGEQQAQAQLQHPIFDLEQLEQQAEDAQALAMQGKGVAPELMPRVADGRQPFSIVMTNRADGQQYVVAHYEPAVLTSQQHQVAAMLAAIYHRRHGKMSRTSAQQDSMVMAGLRIARQGDLGRYAGDEGVIPDWLAETAYTSLKTAGLLPAITNQLGPKVVAQAWAENIRAATSSSAAHSASEGGADPAAQQQAEEGDAPAPAASLPAGLSLNFPAPFLAGSVFTTLAVTRNYLSNLHAEPEEHPLNFIVWADLLGSRAQLKVGYFRLTAGLAFVPQPGSALYLDVRLVTHRSEAAEVTGSGPGATDGRYGCALFIKPPVLRAHAEQWVEAARLRPRRGRPPKE